MSTAYVSLGSNMAPEENLRAAVTQLREAFGGLRLSPVYRSPAAGFDGPDFLNAAAGIETDLPVNEIVNILLRIEDQQLRDRSQPRFSSRTLDLDLLMLDQLIVDTSDLTLPRPEILQQAFVLQPLSDIAGVITHPQELCTIQELWHRFQRTAEGESPTMTIVNLML